MIGGLGGERFCQEGYGWQPGEMQRFASVCTQGRMNSAVGGDRNMGGKYAGKCGDMRENGGNAIVRQYAENAGNTDNNIPLCFIPKEFPRFCDGSVGPVVDGTAGDREGGFLLLGRQHSKLAVRTLAASLCPFGAERNFS